MILLAVIIMLIVLLIRLPPLLHGLSDDIGILFDADEDPVVGMMALALICVTVFSIFRIISNNRR
jgi:hypothetical protein